MNKNSKILFTTKPLSAWGEERSRFKDMLNALQSLKADLCYAVTPRVARPIPPLDPPDPSNKNTPIAEGTLTQCKEIYEQVESSRDYLDEKARATFGVIAFLAPLLMAAFIFLFTNTNSNGIALMIALILGSIAFILLVFGFVSTVRALAVQGRDILFLESVIDSTIPAIRPYDMTRHAKGLLYCASVNASFNAHITQCVRSAHVLTAVAVVIAALAAVPSLVVLATQKDTPVMTQIVGPVEIKTGDNPINDSINKIRYEINAIKDSTATVENINAINNRLDALDAKINSIISDRTEKPKIRKQSKPSSKSSTTTTN